MELFHGTIPSTPKDTIVKKLLFMLFFLEKFRLIKIVKKDVRLAKVNSVHYQESNEIRFSFKYPLPNE